MSDTCPYCGRPAHDDDGPCEPFIADVMAHEAPHPFTADEAQKLWWSQAHILMKTHRTFNDPAVSEALQAADDAFAESTETKEKG